MDGVAATMPSNAAAATRSASFAPAGEDPLGPPRDPELVHDLLRGVLVDVVDHAVAAQLEQQPDPQQLRVVQVVDAARAPAGPRRNTFQTDPGRPVEPVARPADADDRHARHRSRRGRGPTISAMSYPASARPLHSRYRIRLSPTACTDVRWRTRYCPTVAAGMFGAAGLPRESRSDSPLTAGSRRPLPSVRTTRCAVSGWRRARSSGPSRREGYGPAGPAAPVKRLVEARSSLAREHRRAQPQVVRTRDPLDHGTGLP